MGCVILYPMLLIRDFFFYLFIYFFFLAGTLLMYKQNKTKKIYIYVKLSYVKLGLGKQF